VPIEDDLIDRSIKYFVTIYKGGFFGIFKKNINKKENWGLFHNATLTSNVATFVNRMAFRLRLC